MHCYIIFVSGFSNINPQICPIYSQFRVTEVSSSKHGNRTDLEFFFSLLQSSDDALLYFTDMGVNKTLHVHL